MNGLGGIHEDHRDDSVSRSSHACLSLAAGIIRGEDSVIPGTVSHPFGVARIHIGVADIHSDVASIHSGVERVHSACESFHRGSEWVHSGCESFHGGCEWIHGSSESFHGLCEIVHSSCESIHDGVEIIHGACESFHCGCERIHSLCESLHRGCESLQRPSALFHDAFDVNHRRNAALRTQREPRSGSPDVIQEDAATNPGLHPGYIASMKARAHTPGSGSHAGSPAPGHRSTVFR